MNPVLNQTQEDLQLLCRFHDLRREERFARSYEWFKEKCFPNWVEDVRDMVAPDSPDYSPELALLTSYMEMAAPLIQRGTPGAELFIGPISDMLLVWCRMGKYVDYVRQELRLPDFLKNLEKVAGSMPSEVEQIRCLDDARRRNQLVQRAEPYMQIACARSGEARKEILRDYEAVCLHTLLGIAGICNLELAARHVIDNKLRGSYVECGTWQGGSVAYWARSFLRNGGDAANIQVFGFDAFQGMPRMTDVDGEKASRLLYNKPLADAPISLIDGALVPPNPSTATEAECRAIIEASGFPKQQIHIIKGWFQDTLPLYRDQIGPIAVLRLDADFYDATKVCLSSLYDKVVPNGMVIIDDYELYSGCRLAVDEFVEKFGLNGKLIYYGENGRFLLKP